MSINKGNIGNALHSVAPDHVVATADDIYDETLGKYQSELNQQIGQGGQGTVKGAKIGSGNTISPDANGIVTLPNYETNADVTDSSNVKAALGTGSTADGTFLAKNGTWQTPPNTTYESKSAASGGSDVSLVTTGEKYTWNNKADTATTLAGYGITNAYTKTEVDERVSTAHQNYVTVATKADLDAIVSPSTDTIYRVSSYDFTANSGAGAVDVTKYSEYAYTGSAMIPLTVKSQVNEVFDISEYHSGATYTDLAEALGANGANVPESIRNSGMSVTFRQSSDNNKYVQYRYMLEYANTTAGNAAFIKTDNWQGVDDEPIAGSDNLVKSGGIFNSYHKNLQEIVNLKEKSPISAYDSSEKTAIRGEIGSVIETYTLPSGSVKKYQVTSENVYTFSSRYTTGFSGIWCLFWLDANGIILNREYFGTPNQVDLWEDVAVIAPEGATEMWMNVQTSQSGYQDFSIVTEKLIQDEDLKMNVEDLRVDVEQNRAALSKKNVLTAYDTVSGYFINVNVGEAVSTTENQTMTLAKYNIIAGNLYAFDARYSSTVTVYLLYWLDANHTVLKREYRGISGQVDLWKDVAVTAPQDATEMWMNVQTSSSSKTDFKEVAELIQSEDLQSKIDSLNQTTGTKVVVNGVGEMPIGSMPFYIRATYNSEKDIILTHIINKNNLVTFECTYIGSKELTDSQLMTDTYLVSSHTDSTGPLRSYTQYWHLFAQHGYPIPYFANSVGMTSSDVGAEWKDQLDRHYKIGNVTESYIWLLPVIYQDANGHYTRDWNSTATSTTITSLTHISGGSYTQQITVPSISQQQLQPIMEVTDRTYIVDGNIITEPGTYYANELKVSETEIGYDPATISDWFGGANGNPDLTGAQKHVVFTYNYNYKGAQCSVNTTIHCLREAKGYYGGTQQQFFFDNGDYMAMFMIPKANARNGIELDKPFNSPNANSPSYTIYRNSTGLKNINDPVDRQIGMLHNPTNNTYLVGMAAGLSLVKGDTVKDKRNQICLENSLLLNFSPSNKNKFYVSGINTSAFGSGYYPAGYFKEVDYYVSYFEPAENVGQVYWYKDGSRYVIYCHCQSIQNILAINVPAFMDGLKLSIVEKTDNTELLSDTIANGKFFVNYNSNDANYIVLIAN